MSEDTYQAVKAAYRSYGTFINELAKETGWDQIIQTRYQLGIKNGENAAHFFKTHTPETRLSEFGKTNAAWYNKSGWIMTNEATKTESEARILRCPIFDGFIESGLSLEKVNILCKAVHRGTNDRLKQDFPDAEFTSNLKTSKKDECIEKFTIPI